jgi:hypothetical protein
MEEPEIDPIWWLPTFGFFLFVAIEFLMIASPTAANGVFVDPGVGRHLRTAEFILETGQIPRTDPLSFTKAGQPWFDFEWAFETTIGELYRVGGLALICAFCFGVFATTILGIYRTLLQSGFSLSVVLLYTGLAFLTLHLHFAVRPVLFTYFFMVLVVEVWNRRAQPLTRDWIILPIAFAAWANLHPGWIAALLFLGMAIFGRIVDRLSKTVNGDEAPVIPWIGLTLVCALATLLNPWGWTLYHHVIVISTTYKSFALWDEYLPPNFSAPSMSAITVLCIVFIVFLTRLCRNAPRWRWEAMLPVLFFLFEGLKTQRHVLLLVIVAAVPVARDLQVLLHTTWFPWVRERLANFQAQQRASRIDAALALVVVLAFAWLFVRTPIGHNIYVGKSVTPQLVTFLQQHPDRLHRPLTTTWNAGPLLWNMRPDFRISQDDRGDFYGDPTVFAFVDMVNGIAGNKSKPAWRETLDQGNYDAAILDPYLPLNQLMRLQPDWHEVYRDDHAVVYWKDR